MAAKKVIEVNETSIVDLRAELFRKEQQFRQESGTHKVKTDNISSKKPPIWSKPTKRQSKGQSIAQDNYHDNEPTEEEKSLQKSREMLHAKAALYEKMAKGDIEDNEDDDNGGGRFLVDFHKKVYGEPNQPNVQEDDEENNRAPTPPPSCPEDEWVDYVDSLGRSRRCLRKDLKQLQDMEKDIKPARSPSPPTLLSDDMRREMMRKKWEQEAEEAMNKPVGPVHYQNIQFDEVRNHGVGYYQFSKIEEEREKQMETLNKLREETKEQRSRIEKIKDKRRAALEARLAKVRARKKLKTGEGVEEEDSKLNDEQKSEESNEVNEKETDESLKTFEIDEKTDEETTLKTSGTTAIPEWARHKIKQPSIVKSYVNQRRDERPDEFAPPSFYYDATDNKKDKTQTKRGTESNQKQPDNNLHSETRTEETNNANAPPVQYPYYPPPVGNFIGPPMPLQHGILLPNLPPPPVDFTRIPPPGFPPFQMHNYPPFPPPYNIPPPSVPPPWQQLSQQQPQVAFPWQPYPGQYQPTSNEITNSSVSHQEHEQQPKDVTTATDVNQCISGIVSCSNQSDNTLQSRSENEHNVHKVLNSTTVQQTAEAVADFVESIRHKT